MKTIFDAIYRMVNHLILCSSPARSPPPERFWPSYIRDSCVTSDCCPGGKVIETCAKLTNCVIELWVKCFPLWFICERAIFRLFVGHLGIKTGKTSISHMPQSIHKQDLLSPDQTPLLLCWSILAPRPSSKCKQILIIIFISITTELAASDDRKWPTIALANCTRCSITAQTKRQCVGGGWTRCMVLCDALNLIANANFSPDAFQQNTKLGSEGRCGTRGSQMVPKHKQSFIYRVFLWF